MLFQYFWPVLVYLKTVYKNQEDQTGFRKKKTHTKEVNYFYKEGSKKRSVAT